MSFRGLTKCANQVKGCVVQTAEVSANLQEWRRATHVWSKQSCIQSIQKVRLGQNNCWIKVNIRIAPYMQQSN